MSLKNPPKFFYGTDTEISFASNEDTSDPACGELTDPNMNAHADITDHRNTCMVVKE